MLLRGRAPLAVAMTASARPNKVLTPRTNVARSKSGVFGRNIMYFIRGVSDHPRRATPQINQKVVNTTLIPVKYQHCMYGSFA